MFFSASPIFCLQCHLFYMRRFDSCRLLSGVCGLLGPRFSLFSPSFSSDRYGAAGVVSVSIAFTTLPSPDFVVMVGGRGCGWNCWLYSFLDCCWYHWLLPGINLLLMTRYMYICYCLFLLISGTRQPLTFDVAFQTVLPVEAPGVCPVLCELGPLLALATGFVFWPVFGCHSENCSF